VLLFGQALLLAVDAARHFEVELAGAGFERSSFLAQLELGLLRLLAPAPLLGELGFEELLFDGEIRARLLLGLAGENLEARLVLVAKLLLERFAERDFGAAAGAGDHGRVHGRLFTAGRITRRVRKLAPVLVAISGGSAGANRPPPLPPLQSPGQAQGG